MPNGYIMFSPHPANKKKERNKKKKILDPPLPLLTHSQYNLSHLLKDPILTAIPTLSNQVQKEDPLPPTSPAHNRKNDTLGDHWYHRNISFHPMIGMFL